MENTNTPLPFLTRDSQNNIVNSLPPGYKFLPEDDELIKYYLQFKLAGHPIPCDQIHDVNVYNHHPEELNAMCKGEGEQGTYFFTPRNRKYANGSRPDRAIGGFGFWKASGKDNPIKSNDNTIGFKKTLVFYREKPKKDPVKTNWIMKEFTLNKQNVAASSSTNKLPTKLDDWILCKIYKNKRDAKSQDTEKVNEGEKQSQHFEEMTISQGVISSQQMQIPFTDFPISENSFYLDSFPPPPLITTTPSPPEISWDEFDPNEIEEWLSKLELEGLADFDFGSCEIEDMVSNFGQEDLDKDHMFHQNTTTSP